MENMSLLNILLKGTPEFPTKVCFYSPRGIRGEDLFMKFDDVQ